MSNIFSDEAWEEYIDWQYTDKKMVQKINDLIKDINRNGLSVRNWKTRTITTSKSLEQTNNTRTQTNI